MNMISIKDINLANKRVFIRSDLNVPIKDGKIMSDIRIKAALPTIEYALEKGSGVIIASHLGRPVEGEYDSRFSLLPVAEYLKNNFLNKVKAFRFVTDYLNGVHVSSGELILLENVRFNKGEKENDDILAKKYASLCDIFVMDAFGASHRIHASTYSIVKFAPISCIGYLLSNELLSLGRVLADPARPLVAIIGGSKVSTKLTVLDSLAKIVDYLVIGGGIANTFIAAQGNNVGKSLYESELIPTAQRLLDTCNIPIPTDVRVSTEFSENACSILKSINNIQDDEQILDIGDNSIARILNIIQDAKTILWNGPVGVFEFPNFRYGTETIANAIGNSSAFSVVGGGDTLMAIDLFKITDKISYVSTGGGAFLEFIEGKDLPSISIIKSKSSLLG